MALTPGTRLGPYDILSALGAGGMGEVYKARDTRLARTVAIKVLPADAATDAAARARFEREARAIAALSHPHICVVHDVGHQDGVDYLVMELLEGDTLKERIARAKGPLPLDEVLKIGTAIADALDRAHRAGIVHRDLKPANVMLTKSGPKLLDFGLAKVHGAASPVSLSDETGATTVGPGTAKGTILGTIHYMSPEQVEGREADPRSDIWALGALLYEMATGQRPFDGESPASVLGAILKDAPPALSTRQPLTPPAFEHLVERCIEKDPEERWQDVRDVKRELGWVASTGAATKPIRASARPGRPFPWIVAAAALVGAIGWVGWRGSVGPTRSEERTVFSIVPPQQVRVLPAAALSPDGRSFVFVGLGPEGSPALWVRSMETGVAREIPGSGDASYPFWSPDSDAVGFFSEGKLKVVGLEGLPPKVLAPAPSGRGGTWNAGGVILFVGEANGSIYRVSASGGGLTVVQTVDVTKSEVGFRYPAFVDEERFLFTVQGTSPDATGLYLGSLRASTRTRLSGTYTNAVFSNGFVLYVADGMIVARTLDGATEQFRGDAIDVAGPVAFTAGLGFATFSVSRNGLLAYTEGSPLATTVVLREFDRDWSGDGQTMVFSTLDANTLSDIWTMAPAGGTQTPFLVTRFNEYSGHLSPDGRWLAYTSDESGRPEVYVQRFPSGGEKVQIFPQGGTEPQWRSDGRELFFLGANRKLWAVSIAPGTALNAGRPTKVFDQVVDTSIGNIHATHYAVSSDGERFFVSCAADATAATSVVQNWHLRLSSAGQSGGR